MRSTRTSGRSSRCTATTSSSLNAGITKSSCGLSSAVAAFGLTERQARFLVTVMVHAGCFLERQYCTFTGTVAGDIVTRNDIDYCNEALQVDPLPARDRASTLVNRGAIYKFLTKPWDDEQLRNNISQAFQHHNQAKQKDGVAGDGSSSTMRMRAAILLSRLRRLPACRAAR